MADPKPDYRNDYVMARLAVSAYMTPEEIRKQELVCSNDPRQDPLPPGWQVLPGSYVNNNVYGGNQADRPADGMRAVVPPSKDGFAAIAFVDPTTRQIVIGFRGSEWEQGVPAGVAGIATGVAAQNNPVLQLTGKADAVAAAASAKGGAVDWTGPDKAFANPFRDWDPQFTDALKYTQAILDLTKPGGPYAGYSVQVTGHSLGGGLAQLAGQMYGLNGRTFDAPPLGNVGVAGEFVDWARGHGLPAKGKGVDPDFMNYFVNESPLRLAGIHYPGRSMNISGQPEHPPLVHTILNDNIATRHDRMRILDLFDDAARTGALRRTGELPDLHGPRLATAQDPRDPSHPDNAAYARIAGGVEALGKWSGPGRTHRRRALRSLQGQSDDAGRRRRGQRPSRRRAGAGVRLPPGVERAARGRVRRQRAGPDAIAGKELRGGARAGRGGRRSGRGEDARGGAAPGLSRAAALQGSNRSLVSMRTLRRWAEARCAAWRDSAK